MMMSQVVLEAPSGKNLIARALLDSGHQPSSPVQKNPRQLTLSGVQGAIIGSSIHAVNIYLSPTHLSKAKVHLTASVVNRVTCDSPLQGAASVRTLPYLQDLTLADPTFDKPGKVDLLIGCDALQKVTKPEHKHRTSQQPMAWNTVFGWAIMGNYVPDQTFLHMLPAPLCTSAVSQSTDSILLKFGGLKTSQLS